MSLSYLFDPNKQFQDEAGNNNVDGFLRVYIDGTDDRAITYKDFDGSLNQSDITLDINGRAVVIVDSSKTYRLEVYKRDGGMLWTARPMIPSSEGGGGIDPEYLKDLVIKHGGRTSGTYRPMVGATIDIPKSCEVVSELEDDLYGKITSIFADFRTPVLIKSDIDPETPGVTRDFYYWPTARTGADGNYSFVGYDGVRTEIATVHDDNSVTYTTIEVPTASTSSPSMDGTASAGSSTQWSRGDHVHPTDTSREAVSNKAQVVVDSSTTDYPSSKAVADFVNSSIATNTANFLGTYDVVEDLGLSTSATNSQIATALGNYTFATTPTNNDYVFASIDLYANTGADEYRRFKYNGTAWAYEYTLNNSSFTAAQWDAINSGLSSSDKTTYDAAVSTLNAHVADSTIHVTSTDKITWNGKQDAISTDTDSSTISDATTIATGYGSNKVHLNTAARLWAYIQDKISSVLGLTSSSYGGKAATADAVSWVNVSGKPALYTVSETDALLAEKADKVSGATSGHFAGLDANGNLTDSGKSADSFAVSKSVAGGYTGNRYLKLTFNTSYREYLITTNTALSIGNQEWIFRSYAIGGLARTSVMQLGTNGSTAKWYLDPTDQSIVYILNTHSANLVRTYTIVDIGGFGLPATTSFVDELPSGAIEIPKKGLISSWQSTPDNDHYPTEQLVKDSLDGKANDSSVVHLAGAETITGLKTFSGNYGPVLNNNDFMWQTALLPCTVILPYNDWTAAQKDDNHYRQWEIDITSLVDSYATDACVQVTLKSSWNAQLGKGNLKKSISFQLWQQNLVSNVGEYVEASGNASQYFRISNVVKDNNKYVIRIVNAWPASNNYPVLLKLDYLKTSNGTQPTLTQSIVEGWPTWAGTAGAQQRITCNGTNVMLEGDSATDATYSTKIGSSSSHPAIGSSTQPVYVDSNGAVQPCTLKGVYFSQYNADSLSNIIDAFGSGLLVFSKYAGDVYLLMDADSNGATFVCNTTVDGKTYYSTLTVNSSNTWNRTTENIFNNIIVRKHYGANHEVSVITTATDISNGYVEYALDFTDMFFGGGSSILFISLPNESSLAYYFTSIEVTTYPYTTGQNSIDICKFTDLTHDDDGNAIGANDEYTWLRTCNSPNYFQRIKGLKLRCYLNTTSGMTWQAGIELKLKLDFNAVRFDKL